MKNILLRALLFFLPIMAIVVIYCRLDPFRVMKVYANYKPAGQALSVPLNQNRVAAGTFLYHADSVHYDSFIFGSSRSMFYEIADWQQHVGLDARCFHFDASAESVEGILHKIQFLAKKRVEFKNVLLIMDADIFRPNNLLSDHLYMEDPLVVGYGRWLPFHSSHFMAFMDRKFMRAYLDYRITGVPKKYMTDLNVLDDKPVEYDSLTNEIRYVYFEELAAKGEYYTGTRLRKFDGLRDGVTRYSQPVITEPKREVLEEIATLLRASNADVRVIISPLYNQVNFAKADLEVLRSLFGEQAVFDFSGVNELTANYTGYYERSHYRPHIAKAVMDSVYTARPR
jgi:hypothetical protein